MSLYFYIEERYCIQKQRNVAVECHCHEDGTTKYYCLNDDCQSCKLGIAKASS